MRATIFQGPKNMLNIEIKMSCLLLLSLLLTACNFEVETTAGGYVISSPSGIDCREDQGQCVIEDYEKLGDGNDKIVTVLTAFPDDGYQLSHWEGDCSKTHYHKCYVSMQGDLYSKAHFKKIEYAQSSAPNKTVRFVALGDTGEGNATQYKVADAIKSVCDQAGGCQFAVGLGDNIYDDNPLSTYDNAFELKFELPSQHLDFPFFMSLGNHDNDLLFDGLGGFNHAGDIQVAYTFRDDKLSDRWQMPQRYYHYWAPMQQANPLVDFFVLDSNPMTSAPDLAPAFEVNLYKQQERDWFNTALADSSAPWKIAYTHHPLISNGKHGNAGFYDSIPPLGPLTKRVAGEIYRQWFVDTICGKVDVFIAGHDHDLQILKSVPECGKTFFIVSGAGAKSREFEDSLRNPVYWQQDNTAGFFMVTITGNTMNIEAYTVDSSTGAYAMAYTHAFPRRQ
jgi:tartrate-resistant acid phosphatase type 5